MRQSTLLHTSTPQHLDQTGPPPLEARAPHWVVSAMPAPSQEPGFGSVSVTTSGRLSLLSTVVAGASGMDATTLEAAVAKAYVELGLTLEALGRSAIRLWNYLPDPGHSMAPGLDRYMVFNAGRHCGYERWSSVLASADSALPTASAVGIEHDDLTIHCLAADAPGRSVENPRQTPAWQYSARYGPKPPSFSRATLADVGGSTRLLIAGTASIVGEDSTCVGDVSGQLVETFTNLVSLIGSATRLHERPSEALRRLHELRVYAVRSQDEDVIRAAIRARCAPQLRVDLVKARLCRPELLVEIEGVASIAGDGR